MSVSTINSATSSSVETAATNTNTVTPAQSAASPTFDVNTVPVSGIALPPFPYLDYPEKLENGYQHNNQDSNFDEVQLIAGRTCARWKEKFHGDFIHDNWDVSNRLRKNYENAIKSLGGVKVNEITPVDPAFLKLHMKTRAHSQKCIYQESEMVVKITRYICCVPTRPISGLSCRFSMMNRLLG
jgi:hypothetical protein